MEITQEKVLQIKVSGENADLLKSAINKLSYNEKKPGFNNSILTPDERKLIEEIK